MAEPAVVNASPLIYLARGCCFDLLQVASPTVLVPNSVAWELQRRGDTDPAVQALNASPWLNVVPDLDIPAPILAWDLGKGESAVLAWAQAHPGTEAIIDDLAARRCAKTLGLPLRGTLGLVLTAKQRGIIPAARPLLERMRREGMWLRDSVLNVALSLVNE